jgi:hypothetical protein
MQWPSWHTLSNTRVFTLNNSRSVVEHHFLILLFCSNSESRTNRNTVLNRIMDKSQQWKDGFCDSQVFMQQRFGFWCATDGYEVTMGRWE